ncbi:MAG TPA: BON domain-containing protein [Candidatus Dormibacteraeota bacterium]|nr:BON domain-containing protein [Candidatus Dormibacteraeota bacterium]
MDARTQDVKFRRANKKRIPIIAGLLVFAAATMASQAALAKAPVIPDPGSQAGYQARLGDQVYSRLVTIPWYSIFDNLEYSIQGHTVTVSGQVVFPLSKSSVANSLEGLPGVARIVNHVTQLPDSPFDNQIRRAEYRTLFHFSSPLFRYSLGANPSVHIIVDNSRVKLVGVVGSRMDREIAGMRARSVPNVFSVTNDLQVEK